MALIIMKLGSKDGGLVNVVEGRTQINMNPYLILGVFLYGTSFILYTYLLSKYDLGYIIPLTTALVYSVIFIASFIIFKESFTLIKVLGITLILVGLALLNLKK
jgi:drug/metabolite transporter (DMT)-like permease